MDLPVLELWYEALRRGIGIVIETNDPTDLKNKLYRARRDAGDPDLEKLMILSSPTNPTGEIMIAHKTIEAPDE